MKERISEMYEKEPTRQGMVKRITHDAEKLHKIKSI